MSLAQALGNVLLRSFSLLPFDTSGHYRIGGDGYVFARDAEGAELANTWFSFATEVPISTGHHGTPIDLSWQASKAVRTSGLSPLLTVSHRMYVNLNCTYDLGEGENLERVAERLRFHVPLRFVRVSPSSQHASRSSTPTVVGHVRSLSDNSGDAVLGLPGLPVPSAPYAPTLPAYSQLYYSNGDRKIDYSVPLPLYTPHAESEPLLSSEETSF